MFREEEVPQVREEEIKTGSNFTEYGHTFELFHILKAEFNNCFFAD